MNLVVFSHKLCRRTEGQLGYVTDGGFPLQMKAISELFSRTAIVVPCQSGGDVNGLSPLVGNNMIVVPLSVPEGQGFRRKIRLPIWFLQNVGALLREVRRCDAIHTPIPGDIGTIGMVLALLFRKPLFVRHCGNWMVQHTIAERFWKWAMERFAGGRNVMLATGGAPEPPSTKNRNIKWIFSTSLSSDQIKESSPRKLLGKISLRLIVVCRQEKKKGTEIVINSLPLILEHFPQTTLDVVGGGSLLPELKLLAQSLGVAEMVTFHGKIPQARVPDLLRQADIFCYPTTASEGFPKVVVEALACGLPVITTNVSVLPHLIGLGCGIVLQTASPKDLAEAVVGISSNEAGYELMSEKAIKVAAEYTLENWGEFIGKELCRSWVLKSLNSAGK